MQIWHILIFTFEFMTIFIFEAKKKKWKIEENAIHLHSCTCTTRRFEFRGQAADTYIDLLFFSVLEPSYDLYQQSMV